MKEIQLNRKHTTTKNYKKYVALVDDADFELLDKYNWYIENHGRTLYALTSGINNYIRMHRLIMDAKPGQMIDHKDGNGLNNQRSNLRFCTHAQNMQNRKSNQNSTSKYLGVSWHKHTKKWTAQIKIRKQKIYLGVYKNDFEAAMAYNEFAIKYYGEFAKLNFI